MRPEKSIISKSGDELIGAITEGLGDRAVNLVHIIDITWYDTSQV